MSDPVDFNNYSVDSVEFLVYYVIICIKNLTFVKKVNTQGKIVRPK